MSRSAILTLACLPAFAAIAAEPVGRPLSAVTTPLESVTVPLQSVTADEASVHAVVSPMPPTQRELAEIVRNEKATEEERLMALSKVHDQDILFQLMIKPGVDTNIAVRVTALKSIAELDVLRFMEARCSDQRVCAAARERLDAASGCGDRQAEQCKSTVRAYVRRMRDSQ